MSREIWPKALEVLRLTAAGKQCKEVAAIMGVSPWTVRDYRAHAMTRLHAKTMEHAVAKAARLGLLNGVDL